MNNLVVYLVWGLITVVCLIAVYMFRQAYLQQQAEKLRHHQDALLRCKRILWAIETLPDRYLPADIKKILLDYAIAFLSNVPKSLASPQQQQWLQECLQYRQDAQADVVTLQTAKVTSEPQLKEVHKVLEMLPFFVKWQIKQGMLDHASGKQYMDKLRTMYVLAHIDLLIFQANGSLELDKKANALEYLRTALAETSHIQMLEYCEPITAEINQKIAKVESLLYDVRVPNPNPTVGNS